MTYNKEQPHNGLKSPTVFLSLDFQHFDSFSSKENLRKKEEYSEDSIPAEEEMAQDLPYEHVLINIQTELHAWRFV